MRSQEWDPLLMHKLLHHTVGYVGRHGHTVVSYNDDIDAAVQVHLLQTVHQLTDDVVHLLQRVIQLHARQTGWGTNEPKKEMAETVPKGFASHLAAERTQPVSEGVGLLWVDGVNVGPAGREHGSFSDELDFYSAQGLNSNSCRSFKVNLFQTSFMVCQSAMNFSFYFYLTRESTLR